MSELGEFYNIGSNKNYNNLEITKKILRIAKKHITVGNKVKINFIKDRPGHDMRYALNSKKISKDLNWKTSTNLQQGLKKTFLWYISNYKFFKSINKKQIIKRLGNL